MEKSLFAPDGRTIPHEGADTIIRKLYNAMREEGYSAREVQMYLTQEIWTLTLETVIFDQPPPSEQKELSG